MSSFTRLFQIDAPDAKSVILSWDNRRSEFSAISSDASFKAAGDIDAIVSRLRAHFRFADVDQLNVTALEGAGLPEIDPALCRMGDIAARGGFFEKQLNAGVFITLPKDRMHRLWSNINAQERTHIAAAQNRTRSLFDVAVQGVKGIDVMRIVPTGDPDTFLLTNSHDSKIRSRERILEELAKLPKSTALFGPNPGPIGDGAELLIGAMFNHPTLHPMLINAMSRPPEGASEVTERVESASKLHLQSVLSNPDPAARDAAYAGLVRRYPDGLRIERDGPANPNQDGPNLVLLSRQTLADDRIVNRFEEEWRGGGLRLRERLVRTEESIRSTLFREENFDARGKLHSFGGAPSEAAETSIFDDIIHRKGRAMREWHEAGTLLASQSIDTVNDGVRALSKVEWKDGDGRLHREDGPAVIRTEEILAKNSGPEKRIEYWRHGQQQDPGIVAKAPVAARQAHEQEF